MVQLTNLQGAFQPTGALTTGLVGSEQALIQGGQMGLNALQQGQTQAQAALQAGQTAGQAALTTGRGDIQAGLTAAGGVLNPALQQTQQFIAPGAQSQQLSAALTGGLGTEAQAQAFQNYQNSPGQQFIIDRGEKSLVRNAAATGGLGGANLQKELLSYGQGMANQFLQQNIDNLNTATNQGLTAAGQFGNLAQAGAGLQQQAGQSLADIQAQQAGFNVGGGQDLGSLRQAGGTQKAQLLTSLATQLAGGRTREAELEAANIGSTTSAIADLINQQGLDTSNILADNGAQLQNLLVQGGMSAAQAKEQAATILANISTGQASQASIPGVQETGGILSNVGKVVTAVSGIPGIG